MSSNVGLKPLFCITNIQKIFKMNNDALKVLIQEREKIKARLEYLNELIKNLGGGDNHVVEKNKLTEYKGYDPKAAMKVKLLYVLKRLNRFSHSTEIKSMLGEIEGKKPEVFKVSSTLSALRRVNKVHKFQLGTQNRNSFWGSTKWLDENGEILSQYMYDDSILKNDDDQSSLFDDF